MEEQEVPVARILAEILGDFKFYCNYMNTRNQKYAPSKKAVSVSS
jgi:hypothetical protein